MRISKHPEFGYKVVINSHCEHNERSPESYGSWSSSHSNEFESVKKCDITSSVLNPDVTSVHDFSVGSIAYLVWAQWGSGDSFGHGKGSDTEAFALLRDSADAFRLKNALEQAKPNPKAKRENHFYWVSSDGQVVETGFLPWFGYFESLESVHIEAVIIE